MHYLLAAVTKSGKMSEIEDLMEYYDEENREDHLVATKEEISDCLEKYLKEHPESADWEKNELLEEALYDLTGFDIDESNIEEDGSAHVYYNENAKWDWYVVGGRWGNDFKTLDGKSVNSCKLKDLDLKDFVCEAILTPDGEWIENNYNYSEYPKWVKEARAILESFNPDFYITAIDCHI